MASEQVDDLRSEQNRDRVIILGAARSLREDLPPALVSVAQKHRVMDWLLAAFGALEEPDIHFVSGYKAAEVQQQYPHIDLVFNADWQRTGPAGSLALVPLSFDRGTWITYSDVVFRPDTVLRMAEQDADVVLAIDCSWRDRYDGRSKSEFDQAEKLRLTDGAVAAIGKQVETSEAGAEFVGVLRLSGAATRALDERLRSGALNARAALPEIVSQLTQAGLTSAVIDVRGDWAELNVPQDLSHFVLGTKAESLARIKPLLKSGVVGDLYSFDHQQWRGDPEQILTEIKNTLGADPLIVRSSALSEDQWSGSAAGAYESVAHVDGNSKDAVTAAIETVFESYGPFHARDQVLVQQMLSDIDCSGVVMTRTPNLGSPYSVISFDDKSNRTDTVTAGIGDSVRTVFVHRGHSLRDDLPRSIHRVLEVTRELEELVHHDSIDIEFAYTPDDVVHIFQARPIALPRTDYSADDQTLADVLDEGKRFFAQLQKPAPFVVGGTTQLSVMSDWNPAEIIGTKPKRLAFSLYREIITDEVWATQRAEYGYRDVRPCNLIVDVLGHPYIDVRATFNSFVPDSLPEETATRLIDHYLALLSKQPELHDKVEFSILFTCLTFDFDARAAERLGGVLSDSEIQELKTALCDITNRAIERCSPDFDAIQDIEARFLRIMAADLPPLERAFALLEDLQNHGTLLFSHLARAGFVAASLLRSLPSTGVVGDTCENDFVLSLETVSGNLQRDARAVASGDLEWDALVDRYGHLRPGTYDITSPHYASMAELYLRPVVETAGATAASAEDEGSAWDPSTRDAIAAQLTAHGITADIDAFERFLTRAIEGRELCKFVFTRSLSAALEALAEFGSAHGVDRERLAHVHIRDLWKLRAANQRKVESCLEEWTRQGEEDFRLTEAICLPGQILSEVDFGCFEQLKATPNFVTSKTVRAPVVCLAAGSSADIDVEGKIVVIPSADPGFDWLFSRNITGLITMYGGGNSHMAIRAAEFGLPAAIGVGELLFGKLAQAEVIELDCASRMIRVDD